MQEMLKLHEEMNQLFQNSFSRFGSNPQFESFFDDQTLSPRMNIEEKDNQYVITTELPGAKLGSINVVVNDGQVSISGETSHENNSTDNQGNGSMIRRERFFGSFQRVVPLPDDADPTKVTQNYKDGVLTVTIGKRANP